MYLRYVIFVFLFVCVGCESTGMNHRTIDLDRSISPNPTLTSYPTIPAEEDTHFSQTRSSEVLKKPELEKDTPSSIMVDPFPTVYFPFDSWEINSEVKGRLDATVGWLNRYPRSGLTIEGHTDVRGSESYNMVLGAKRAHAVKEYLSNLGISPQRMGTVSYGKELILCEVDDEKTCHQYNRRADMLLE